MPVTLAQAQLNAAVDLDYAVIDNLRRSSWLFDQIVFDDVVTPGTGGASLQYGYTRLVTAASAGFRAFNQEFVPGQATRAQATVNLKPMGGAYTLDRDLANLGPASTNENTFQLQQLLASIPIRFARELLFGDIAVDPLGFDGLNKALAGTTTEVIPNASGTAYADWTNTTINTVDKAHDAMDLLDLFLSKVVPSRTGGMTGNDAGELPPGVKAIMGNTDSITRVRSIARRAGTYTESKDDLGRTIKKYGDWVLVDLGDREDGSAPLVPIETRDPDGVGAGGNITGLTDLYAATFGIDSLHGASKAGSQLLRTWLPDFSTAGAVKTGEVQLGPAAMVLKNTKAAAVLRNLKVR
ncbi:major capsid protein [Amycolatopsis kentuckyensis]|uniref:major capsid protein n=1 Tax=Amycolatopsis kentuckyensis TaxID=218823 RepID=UPI000A3A30D8|nr:phage capsid protein [Amycolatopsis kentuckyensis]